MYIHDTSPRAKKFFDRSASRGFTPSGAATSLVSDVIGTRISAVAVEAAVVERVDRRAVGRRVAGLLQVALVEGVLVDDQRPARLEAAEVGAQRGGVHRHEHVRLVAGRGDRVVGDVHLEAGHAVHGAGGGTDLGGVLGQGRQVVAVGRAHRGEAVAGELHAVTGVAGEADDHPVEGRRTAPARSRCRPGSPPSSRSSSSGRRRCRPPPPYVHRTRMAAPSERTVRDMHFAELAAVSDQLAATSKRGEKAAAARRPAAAPRARMRSRSPSACSPGAPRQGRIGVGWATLRDVQVGAGGRALAGGRRGRSGHRPAGGDVRRRRQRGAARRCSARCSDGRPGPSSACSGACSAASCARARSTV